MFAGGEGGRRLSGVVPAGLELAQFRQPGRLKKSIVVADWEENATQIFFNKFTGVAL
jgi:hypothetical protein